MDPTSAAEPGFLSSSAQGAALAVLAHVPDVMREIRRAMRQAAPEGVSVPQFRSLIFTQRYPGSTLGELAAHLGVTMPTASVMVARLQREGWLAVETDAADKRRRVLVLTPGGWDLVEAAWAYTRENFARRLENLGEPALQQLTQSLTLLGALWPSGPRPGAGSAGAGAGAVAVGADRATGMSAPGGGRLSPAAAAEHADGDARPM